MKKNGFSLIELLVTIAIIGILAAAATTAYIGSLKKAARSEAYTNLDALRLLEEAFFADRAAYAPSRSGAERCADDANSIQCELPGFQPGPSGSFDYDTFNNAALPATPAIPYGGSGSNVDTTPTPCFVAIATGIAGSRVEGDVFAIDCNNNKNY